MHWPTPFPKDGAGTGQKRLHEAAVADRKARVLQLDAEHARRHRGSVGVPDVSCSGSAPPRAQARAEAEVAASQSGPLGEHCYAQARAEEAQAEKYRKQLEKTVARHERERLIEERRRRGVEVSHRKTFEQVERRRRDQEVIDREKEAPWEHSQVSRLEAALRQEQNEAHHRAVAERVQRREQEKAEVRKTAMFGRRARVRHTAAEGMAEGESTERTMPSLLSRISTQHPSHSFL